jgi:flavin reductase (DIM6/NTAB) family NADH-FMN oxidoreductase RutF
VIVFDPAEHSPGKSQGMLSSLIVPRPIAMVSTANADGLVNVAPFSYYMPVTGSPPLLAVTIGGRREGDGTPKHTWENLNRTGDFVINVTTESMSDHIEVAAIEFPGHVSESEVVGWHAIPSQRVEAPSIAESPAHLECRLRKVVDFGDDEVHYSTVHLVVAEVVCIVLDESVCSPDLKIDQAALQPIGRMALPYFTAASDALFGLERISYEEHLESGVLPGRVS